MKQSELKHKWINPDIDNLFKTILELKNLNEARKFFRDLLTEKEIIEFAQRWKVAKLLAKKISYVQIEKETGMSSTTIARVHKWLKKGMGGYRLMIKRLNNEHE
ncbi:MAG: hypothetical protein HQ536_01940 [Parcubacteria group bacterium]|nr:hypothetical protein [Parcubacteria group bacterium]